MSGQSLYRAVKFKSRILSVTVQLQKLQPFSTLRRDLKFIFIFRLFFRLRSILSLRLKARYLIRNISLNKISPISSSLISIISGQCEIWKLPTEFENSDDKVYWSTGRSPATFLNFSAVVSILAKIIPTLSSVQFIKLVVPAFYGSLAVVSEVQPTEAADWSIRRNDIHYRPVEHVPMC